MVIDAANCNDLNPITHDDQSVVWRNTRAFSTSQKCQVQPVNLYLCQPQSSRSQVAYS
jgi:hypothetical protein